MKNLIISLIFLASFLQAKTINYICTPISVSDNGVKQEVDIRYIPKFSFKIIDSKTLIDYDNMEMKYRQIGENWVYYSTNDYKYAFGLSLKKDTPSMLANLKTKITISLQCQEK